MAKTIISLLSGQLLPNYLVIKEKCKDADGVKGYKKAILITTTQTGGQYDIMKELLKNDVEVEKVELTNIESWEEMRQAFQKIYDDGISENVPKYLVNLTGGTKYMSQCLHEVSTKENNRNNNNKGKINMIYVPLPKNKMLYIGGGGIEEDIKFRVDIQEYLKLCGITLQEKAGFKESLQTFQGPTARDLEGFDLLREGVPWSAIKDDAKVQGFLKQYFPTEDLNSFMSDARRRAICGDWFERFICWKLTEALKNEKGFSLTAGEIPPEEDHSNNEIDCIFTLNNSCFMVECKTGCTGQILNETLYKDATLNKSVIQALSAKNYIFLFMKDAGFQDQKQRAKNLKIGLYFGEYFLNENKFKELIRQIKQVAGLKEEGENAN